ncbi:MAG: DMT family transporter [Burkholderiaceae bacterium]|nr:DMT family transporter [Burkholderiaceae bacterium]
MKQRDIVDLLLLAALWGGSFLFIRVAVGPFGPFPLMLMRTAIGAFVLLPLLLRGQRMAELRANAGRIALIGVVNSAVPFVLYGYAMMRLSAGYSSILNATVPFWSALVAFAWMGERMNRLRVLGLVTGFAGVLVLVWGHLGFGDEGLGLPILSVLGATLSYGIGSVATKKHLSHIDSMTAAGGSLVFAAAALLPFAALAWPANSPGALDWLSAVLLGVFCTGFAYVVFFRLIERIGSVGAVTVTFLVPAFAMLWGALLLGEAVTARMIAGTAIILVGTSLTTGLLGAATRPNPAAALRSLRRTRAAREGSRPD